MKKLITLFALLFGCFPILAFVNIQNGNYTISYTDVIVLGGGGPLDLTRTYNSKTTYSGWFGYGWGSMYETYVEVAPDTSLVIHEHGGGAETRFLPKSGNVDATAAAIKVADAYKSKNNIDKETYNSLVKKLKESEERRREFAKQIGIKTDIPVGTVLHASNRGLQQVERTKDGFIRTYNEGRKEIFNQQGKLVKIQDKGNYSIDIEYAGTTLKSIRDSMAKQIFFEMYPDGKKVKSAWTTGNEKATYTFDGEDLIASKDASTKPHIYKYSYDKKHNLIKVEYPEDKTTMELAYEPQTDFISSIKYRGGNITEYKYDNKKDPSWTNYSVTITSKVGKNVTGVQSYSYKHKRGDDGSLKLLQLTENDNNILTDTQYNENCSQPEKITSGNITTAFKYDEQCSLVEKSSSTGEYSKLTYDKKCNKVSRLDKKTPFSKDPLWVLYTYNEKCELEKAVSSLGQTISLFYNYKGQIYQMVEATTEAKSPQSKEQIMKKRALSFEYNAQGKPVEITMDKVGKIKVTYNNVGDVLNVDSSGNDDMTYQLTETFQNLLSIVEPAAVAISL